MHLLRPTLASLVVLLLPPMAATAQTSCGPRLAPPSLVPPVSGTVQSLTTYDDESATGPCVFAATSTGVFRLASGSWINTGFSGGALALEVVYDGLGPAGGPSLIAGGTAVRLARWNGSAWNTISPQPSSGVVGVGSIPDSQGSATLYAVLTGGTLVRLVNGQWQPVATFSTNVSNTWTQRVLSFDEDGPSGPIPPSIYFAASITSVTYRPAATTVTIPVTSGIVRFDGQTFTSLAPNPVGAWIKCLEVFDDGVHGPSLYLSGPGGQSGRNIVRWDSPSQAWDTPTPGTTSGDVAYGMGVLPDGLGINADRSRLYAFSAQGLGFTSPPFVPAAAYTGATWSVFRPAPTFPAPFLSFHMATATGPVGIASTPVLIGVSNTITGGNTFFGILGCPRCPADFDLDATASIGDLFLFLDNFFTQHLSADINSSGSVTSQDLFDFITDFSLGCP